MQDSEDPMSFIAQAKLQFDLMIPSGGKEADKCHFRFSKHSEGIKLLMVLHFEALPSCHPKVLKTSFLWRMSVGTR